MEPRVANCTRVGSRSGVLLRVVLCLSCLTATHWACAHPNLDEAITRITALIAESPGNAELFLRRAELLAVHGDSAAAEIDFNTDTRLDPGMPHLARLHGWFLLTSGRAADAVAQFDQALRLDSSDADAWVLRARARAQLGQTGPAIADYTQAIALLREPRPELFLERADAYPDPLDALRSLDAAMTRIGPVLTLQLRAIELETRLGRGSAALNRLDAIIARSENTEIWTERRAELLAKLNPIPPQH
jgi:tetratricopeptide (TPR) repeat protein